MFRVDGNPLQSFQSDRLLVGLMPNDDIPPNRSRLAEDRVPMSAHSHLPAEIETWNVLEDLDQGFDWYRIHLRVEKEKKETLERRVKTYRI